MSTLFYAAFQDSIRSSSFRNYPLFVSFLQCVSRMPLSWRKLALTVCRVQQSPKRASRISSEVDRILQGTYFPIVNPITLSTYSLHDLVEYLHISYTSPIMCSLTSYVVRAEVFSDEEANSIITSGIIKEIDAALSPDTDQSS